MLGLRENTPLEMLRQFAVYLNAEIIESHGSGQLILDNAKGRGSIKLFELYPGLTAWVYNIQFFDDLSWKVQFNGERNYYLGYHLKGRQRHKFESEEHFIEIQQWQNFFILGTDHTVADFVIPGGEPLQSCYLILKTHLITEADLKIKTQLETHLENLFRVGQKQLAYRYLGQIDTQTGHFVETIIKNERTDLVGRLLTEGAVMGMLASQLESHQQEHLGTVKRPELSIADFEKIKNLTEIIRDNPGEKIAVDDLAARLGFSSRKLQRGIRIVYGYSAHEFITNVRMELARELMETTDMNVSEICYNIGYSSRSHFSKMFRARFGVVPSSYRKST